MHLFHVSDDLNLNLYTCTISRQQKNGMPRSEELDKYAQSQIEKHFYRRAMKTSMFVMLIVLPVLHKSILALKWVSVL